jgi:hypothetical protein
MKTFQNGYCDSKCNETKRPNRNRFQRIADNYFLRPNGHFGQLFFKLPPLYVVKNFVLWVIWFVIYLCIKILLKHPTGISMKELDSHNIMCLIWQMAQSNTAMIWFSNFCNLSSLYICIYTYIYICIYTYICVCVYICKYAYINIIFIYNI